ncbi:MAG: sulfurtransferase [Thermotaleaceae bacterium]
MKKISVVLLALILVLAMAGCNKPQVKTEAELAQQREKYGDYANGDKILSALEAKELIDGGGNIVIVDVTKSTDYLLGHIEGAVNVWRPDYSADSGDYSYGGMRASREKMASLLGSLGADKDTKFIVYSNNHNYDATRFIWQLELFGHEDAVLIDGGLQGWKASGLSTTTAKPSVTAREYEFPGKIDESILATVEDVKAAINDGNVVIWDTRAEDEYTGAKQLDGAFRKGAIPSSVWMEYTHLIHSGSGEDSTFKTAAEMKALLEAKGITPDKTIIPYCQSGVRSSLAYTALKMLGYENVKNYDGSWIEWSYDENLPIEIGVVK